MHCFKNHISIIYIGITISILTLNISCTRDREPELPYPNIIFIMTDDMGYGDASCYNRESLIPTPNIDKLASEGMRFTDAHSPSSVCTPTRYSVLTGRYAWRSRLKDGVFGGFDKPLIDPGRVTVASFLKSHGYATACIGKWHLGWHFATKDGKQPPDDGGYEQLNVDFSQPTSGGPNDLGFDYFFGTAGCPTDDPPMCFFENYQSVGLPDKFAEEDPADEGRDLLTVTNWRHEDADITFKNKTIEFINEHTKSSPHKPFFVYLPLSVPHIPWLPPDIVKGKSSAGPRGDQVVLADLILGEIVSHLENLGISENTLVIFTSDNGPRQGINGHKSAMNWRGYKGSIWEGGHRIPFIAKWPAKIKPGSISHEVIVLTDLMATLAAIIERKLPQGAGEDSYNILPVLLAHKLENPVRDVTIHHSGGGVFAIRSGDWKYIHESLEAGYHNPPAPLSSGQLYNLRADPGEQDNLYYQLPDKVHELKKKLKKVQRGKESPENGNLMN